jgi:hypothetical protein
MREARALSDVGEEAIRLRWPLGSPDLLESYIRWVTEPITGRCNP